MQTLASRLRGLGAAFLVLLPTPAALADLTATEPAPLAPQGGILMVPLESTPPRRGWPAETRLELDDGRILDAQLAWVRPAAPDSAAPRSWTDESAPLAIRAIRPDDAGAGGRPYLLARLPADGAGPIFLGRQELDARWFEVPRTLGFAESGAPRSTPLPWVAAPDRPARDPFAFWRWSLLAERLGLADPSLAELEAESPIAAAAAEHGAAVWRFALGRLAATNPGAAATCVDWLTRTGDHDGTSFATWIADPAQTGRLLSELLAPNRSAEQRVRAAVIWTDACPHLLAWPETDDGRTATIAVINRDVRPLVLRLMWEAADDVPIAAEIPPGALQRVRVERPAPLDDGLAAVRGRTPPPTTLVVEGAGPPLRIVLGPGATDARPPGVSLGRFRAPLQPRRSGTRPAARAIPTAWATSAHVRRREGRWEVFFEARRPQRVGADVVELHFGPEDNATTLVIPDEGAYTVPGGETPSDLEVHRGSFPEGWRARIVLPEAWLPQGAPLFVGATRRCGASVATAPGSGPPWAQRPGRIVAYLATWDGPPTNLAPTRRRR